MEETNVCPICKNMMVFECGFNPSFGDYDKRICKGLNHILILSSFEKKCFKAEMIHNGYQYYWNFLKNKLKITNLKNKNSFKLKNFYEPDFYNPKFLSKLEFLISFN